MKRRPAVAGYFYPANREELLEMIEWSYKHKLGPGSLPSVSSAKFNGIGYVVPHAGYMYSGPVAANAYYALAARGIPDVAIILGTNHTGLGRPVSVYPGGSWETPLGEVPVDEELGKRIVEYSEIAEFDTYAHLEEHSVEVQLPYLQHLFNGKLRIVPVVIGIHTPEIAEDLARAIDRAVREMGVSAVVLASSDFTHYEPHSVAAAKDGEAIKMITELNTKGFYDTMISRNITICGPGGIMTLMEYAKLRKGAARLLRYATSGDVTGERGYVVGYAAIEFA